MPPILWYSLHMEESITPQITPEDAKRVQLQFLTQLHEAVPRTAPAPLTGLPAIHWSEYGVSSDQQPISLDPPANWMPFMPLPIADVVVLTWTKAEWAALNQVFCSYTQPMTLDDVAHGAWMKPWTFYARNYYTIQQDMVNVVKASQGGAPSLTNQAWGSFRMVHLAGQRVLLLKSDMHLTQDGRSLPLRQFVAHICQEAQPAYVLSVGTAGGVRSEDALGCALITNAAYFYLLEDFKNAEFNRTTVTSSWQPATGLLPTAQRLLIQVPGYTVLPLSPHYPPGASITPNAPASSIKVVTPQPIITTDSFMFGTTTNGLEQFGCIIEMDDAVVGMACDQHNTPFGFIRNVSDPVINGLLPPAIQTSWAGYIYQQLGLYTSFNGALAAWAVMVANS